LLLFLDNDYFGSCIFYGFNDTAHPITLHKERPYVQLVLLRYFTGELICLDDEEEEEDEVDACRAAHEDYLDFGREPLERGRRGCGWSDLVRDLKNRESVQDE
jgi:hypothetical protein